MDDELRTLLLQHAPAEAVAAAAVAGGMQTLKMDAFAKVQEGATSFDELKRLVDQQQDLEHGPATQTPRSVVGLRRV